MTDVLILGGTGWLSSRIAARWLDHGASVTALARGARPAPDGVLLANADRDRPDAYDVVAQHEWDEVVDISSRPAHVLSALTALAPRARHWTYVSSLSVYASDDVVGADESAPTAEPLQPGEEYDYSRAKAAAEASVLALAGERAAIVRPGLIVGPGDPTDRFGYWVGRFALAGAEPVLVPEAGGTMAQVIDVDDLANFAVAAGSSGWTGTANAISGPVPLRSLLDAAREAAGHTGDLAVAPDEWLVAHDVQYWMGPRSLPLWLPADMPGFSTRSNAAYRAAGGRVRPLADTLARTLADERARGLDRDRQAGLTRDDELRLLTALGT